MTGTVRFSEVLKVGGKPKQYLPFADPRRDKAFAEAEREQRIVSLKQAPTGNQKDHGIIGVLREKFVSYLIFQKSLSRFVGHRVVGINYGQLAEADAIMSPPPKVTSRSACARSRPDDAVSPRYLRFQAAAASQFKSSIADGRTRSGEECWKTLFRGLRYRRRA